VNHSFSQIPSIQFLVDAVEPEAPYSHYSGSVEDRLIWVVGLMEKIEQRKVQSFKSLAQN
jgi:phytoene synthase